jgi:hypothetical protein
MALADRQYHLTDPDGRQYVFCSGACLLSYACHGTLSADLKPAVGAQKVSEVAA